MPDQAVATQEEWLTARRELLDAEKEHMQKGDELTRKRRGLPWVPVEKDYVFETEDGQRTLAELFDGSCSSTTSCSASASASMSRTRDARAAPWWPTTSTASDHTSTGMT